MLRTWILSVVLLAMVVPAWGQPRARARDSAAPPAGVRGAVYTRPLYPPVQFDKLGRDQGLPQNQVTDIVQDAQGFMWIGTLSGGVARFDGYEMRTFSALTGATLPSQFITALALDADGKLWIGTGEAGLGVYDPQTNAFTGYAPGSGEHGLKAEVITALFRDSAGRLWVGGGDGILYRYDAGGDRFVPHRFVGDIETDIRAIAQASGTSLWIGTGAAGLFQYDPDKDEVTEHYDLREGKLRLASNDVRAALVDSKGALWVGTAEGLHRLDPGGDQFQVYTQRGGGRIRLSDSRITRLYEDTTGTLWVGTEDGLNTLDPERRTVVRYVSDPGHPVVTATFPTDVADIEQSRDGVIWIGGVNGVLKLDLLRLRISNYVNAASFTNPITFLEGEPGELWVGTYKSGLLRYERNRQQVTVYTYFGRPGEPGAIKLTEWINDLHRDREGKMWIVGIGLGLIMFDPRTGEHKQFLPNPESFEGPTADHIERIVEDRSGYLWLATWGGGLNRFDPRTEEFLDFVADEEDRTTLSSSYLHELIIDRDDPNILWIGTARGGLNRFDIRTQRASRYSLAPEGVKNAPQDIVQSIHQSKDGVLWLATDGGGLIRFDPKSGEKQDFTTDDGLAHNTVYGILSDDDGRLWMSTNGGGISVFDPSSREFVTTYTSADGLVSNEFNANGYYRGADGRMYFAGIGGFNVFDPANLEPDTYTPSVAITSFQIFNREANLDQPIWTRPHIHLGYGDSVFSFEFAALSYAAPERVRYAYKMDGLHDWIETNRRFVTYTNVDGGDYVFRVKAQNRHGVWSDDTVAVNIAVATPPWKTWWAYSLYTLAAIGIVFAYMRSQTRKVEALRQAHRLESVERDLELTGAVQAGFLPSSNTIESPRFQLFGFYRPADRASGDWWWYEEASNTLSILVGDVTGHGPGPAMVTAAAATAFRFQGKSHGITMADRLTELNEEVLRVGVGNYQMTMSAVELDGSTGRFVFHSAGGLPIMRLRDDGRPRLLPCPGTPLGTKAFVLGRVEGTLVPGERMLLYTDGIPEIPLRNGRLLGMRRFSMICENTRRLTLLEAAQQIVMSADMLRQDQPQDDDWTFALVEWNGA